MPTSDGIKDSDWEQVRHWAQEIVDAVDSDVDTEFLEKQILICLGRLEKTYGRLPSILSTKADYLDNCDDSLRLLKEAYVTADELDDKPNLTLISGSLLEHYRDAGCDQHKIDFWKNRLRQALKDSPDTYYEQLLLALE